MNISKLMVFFILLFSLIYMLPPTHLAANTSAVAIRDNIAFEQNRDLNRNNLNRNNLNRNNLNRNNLHPPVNGLNAHGAVPVPVPSGANVNPGSSTTVVIPQNAQLPPSK